MNTFVNIGHCGRLDIFHAVVVDVSFVTDEGNYLCTHFKTVNEF
jgi:hypothetical protein